MALTSTLWLTGLPAAGKTTLANAQCSRLIACGQSCVVLDGDQLRRGLCSDLGFSRDDRRENIRRVAHTSRLLNEAGVLVIVALVSPYRDDREMARHIIGTGAFREVWLATPLAICEQRDPKGLYRGARVGTIEALTGIDSPYEEPHSPHLTLRTDVCDIPTCLAALDRLLQGVPL